MSPGLFRTFAILLFSALILCTSPSGAADNPDPAVPATPPASAAAGTTPQPSTYLMASPSRSATGSVSVFPMFSALLVVLALIGGIYWVLKRTGLTTPMRQQGQLRVISQLSIGARERIVILEVQERWIVVGVTPGGMSRLGTFPKGIAAESDTGNPMVQMPSFAALIDRMRGNAS